MTNHLMALKKSSRKNPLLFDVARLWNSPEGTSEKYSIEVKPVFADADFEPASALKAELLFIKLKEMISVLVREASVNIGFDCVKCLRGFTQEISFKDVEREFHFKKQRDDLLKDIYHIDTKEMTVDLADMFRQEIILHFPLIPVCSKRCRGLCPKCGKDRNKTACKCRQEEPETHQPFKNLKKLIK